MTVPKRVIAIGDIHGCAAAVAALIEAIGPGPEDILVPLGDYIDRGPDSRAVLDQMIDLAQRCRLVPLLGNHEEMLIKARSGGWSQQVWLCFGGKATLASYGPDARLEDIPPAHWQFLAGCRKWYETESHVFTHAKESFRLPDEPVDERPLWPLFTGKIGVVGHAAQKNGEIRDEGCIKCIDTNCYAGGWLTAQEVNSGRVWQADERGRLR
jgi:serine/threonine protein phosphatase 1